MSGANSLPFLPDLSTAELTDQLNRARARWEEFRSRGLSLNMTRGKPADDQLDLSNALLDGFAPGDYLDESGGDARNYFGGVQGLPEARRLLSPLVGAPVDQMVVDGNSSLALMHDTIAFALLQGVPGGNGPWSKQDVTFLCPVPGYDRHFAICEGFGIRMVTVPMTETGPDMDVVERLVASDATIKGMWNVPKYSNPTGVTYSDDTVARLAGMPTAAPDFRLFWDNAYGVHHLTTERREIANILEACSAAGNPDRAFVFASTSKITFAGAGLAVFGASPANIAWFAKHQGRRTIGPDKLNQLRHVRYLKDEAGLLALMDKHRAILQPKFDRVDEVFASLLGGTGIAKWSKPQGGYFIDLDVVDGAASRVVALAKAAGLTLTPAGATFPHGKDPDDRNIRIAPSFPPPAELSQAAEGVALSVLVAGLEVLLAKRGVKTAEAAE